MTETAWADAICVELDPAGLPSQGSIAGHIRAAAAGGLLLRSRIVRALKESYAPFHCEETALHEAIHQACDALVDIGDLTPFQSDSGPGYVATPERLVDLGESQVALLGLAPGSAAPTLGLVRRLLKGEALERVPAPLITLADEIGIPAWRLHLVAAGGSDSVLQGPATLFARLAAAAAAGDRLEQTTPDVLRVLAKSGSYFGKAQAPVLDGRWAALSSPGAFCAVRRRAYAWQNCIVSAGPDRTSAIDVGNFDCWQWAVVGQTLAQGQPVAEHQADQLQCLTPPPQQIQRLLDLAGERSGAWRWRVEQGPADLALQLLGQTTTGSAKL